MWTKKAAAHLTLGIFSLIFAIITGSLGLSVVGLFFTLTVLVGYLLQRRIRVNYDRVLSNNRARERDLVQVQATIRALGIGTGFIEVRDRLDKRIDVSSGSNYRLISLPRRGSKRMDYELRTPIRGLYGLGPLQVRKTDTFELFYNVYEMPESIEGLTVYPLIDDIKDANLRSLFPKIVTGASSVRNPGIGSDFYALRDYTNADPMRDVNWKASARRGELIVNQWMHETIKLVTFVFDARAVNEAGTLGANPMLYNCRAAATVADYFVGDKATIRFVDYGENINNIQPDSGERQMQKIMDRLAQIEGRGKMAFSEVANHLLPQLKARAPLVVFTGLEEDATFYDGLSLLMARNLRVLVVVPSSPDFLLRAQETPMTKREYELRRVRHQMEIKRLRGLGASVAVWEPDDRLGIAIMTGLAR